MSRIPLLPAPKELELVSVAPDPRGLVLHLRTSRTQVACPECGQSTSRVHSRYARTLTDLPWQGSTVQISLQTRRFFCRTSDCRRRIFAERLPGTAARYARRTRRLATAFDAIALALGGEAGARLSGRLSMEVSPDTLLRRLHTGGAEFEQPTPRCLGVDDWAWRKGRRYGTILCDLERGRVVDLLPDRSAEALEAWLHAHPGVEVISRDRAGVYAEGARRGAPDALQVADRWHLRKNLTEALQKLCQAKHTLLRDAALQLVPDPEVPKTSPPTTALSPVELHSRQSREQRLAQYTQLMRLLKAGYSHREAAAHLGISKRTVTRWVAAGAFPERSAYPRQPSILDPYRAYLQNRIGEGVTSMTQLLHEIQAQGYPGSQTRLWTYLQKVCPAQEPRPSLPTPPSTFTPQRCAWLLSTAEEQRTAGERAFLRALRARWSECEAVEAHAQEFVRIFHDQDAAALEPWLEAASAGPLARFARGLKSDLAAVRAAITEPWSNGPTEGHINRLKTLKRQMYGRAGLPLLRARMLAA
jgi:transposase